eukprot:scaffold19_cov114-Cylindrotheca_fusiformis.AAC.1
MHVLAAGGLLAEQEFPHHPSSPPLQRPVTEGRGNTTQHTLFDSHVATFFLQSNDTTKDSPAHKSIWTQYQK